MPAPTVLESFTRGMIYLDTGKTGEALRCFDHADKRFHPPLTVEAEIKHLRGICLRMLSRYKEAEEALSTAFSMARTAIHQGRITRDWAMVYLEQGEIDKAAALVQQSLELLKKTDEVLTPAENRHRSIEYITTLGFRSRVDAARIKRARLTYKLVRRLLRGIAPYELNTLVWELKLVPLQSRLELFPRGVVLAVKARNIKRLVQVLLLTFARPLGLRFDKN